MDNKLTPATELTLKIVEFINSKHYYATRIVTAGIYDEKEQRWKRSGTDRGTADIHACINGQHISIEIKCNRDQLRKKQIEVKQRIEIAGGYYWEIKTFEQFQDLYFSFLWQYPKSSISQ